MKQIYMDVGVENLLFIRYNPDKYLNIPGHANYGIIAREQYLLKYISERDMHQGLGVVYLFYDGFMSPPEIEYFDPYNEGI